MEFNLKKRILGGVVLAATSLLLMPLFFLHSASMEDLQRSMHIPTFQPTLSHKAAVTHNVQSVPLNITTNPLPSAPLTANSRQAMPVAPRDNPPSQSQLRPQAPPQPIITAIKPPAAAPIIATTRPIAKPVVDKLALPSSSAKNTASVASQPANQKPTLLPAGATEPTSLAAVHPPKSKKNNKPVVSTKNTKATLPTTTTITPNKTAGWAIQVATLSDKIDAQNLSKKLRTKHFPAYMRTTKTAQGQLIQVFIGPESQRQSANLLLSRLSAELGMTGVLVKAHS